MITAHPDGLDQQIVKILQQKIHIRIPGNRLDKPLNLVVIFKSVTQYAPQRCASAWMIQGVAAHAEEPGKQVGSNDRGDEQDAQAAIKRKRPELFWKEGFENQQQGKADEQEKQQPHGARRQPAQGDVDVKQLMLQHAVADNQAIDDGGRAAQRIDRCLRSRIVVLA